MIGTFYREFEDRHRGSRELIKTRLKAYLPFLEPLQSLHPDLPALDIGCGRGEWLELLLELGAQAQGVDLDDGMLQACIKLDLPARKGDALATLREMPDASLALVSGFHIAEHLPFDLLLQVTIEALRVLRPGGLLILETPNAENLAVGSHYFYMDPTHERPIPHLLLSFVTENGGFARSKLLRLQEPEQLREAVQVRLIDVITGTSPDYAVIAQKNAPEEQLAIFQPAFEREYGLSLDTLAQRYDDRLAGSMQALEQRIEAADEHTHQMYMNAEQALASLRTELQPLFDNAEQNRRLLSDIPSLMESVAQNQQLLIELQQAREQLTAALTNADHWYAQAQLHIAHGRTLENSLSWKITHPLRVSSLALRNPVRQAKAVCKRGLVSSMRFVLKRPETRQRVMAQLRKHPRLYERLRRIAGAHGLVGNAPVIAPQKAREVAAADLSKMSPRARQFYQELKQAIRDKSND
ncbi:hypothetical protein UB43_22830 [Pseudomonas sp. 21]|uniref:class I SAM-dependent methyltransferase n=1 Tax=unclassified Pseudomonas TaxID=196821 RepID=UPI0005EB5E36|nr:MULTISPECIES: class I SAM-dependent methyltransferase [unclassified Pseudomonas]KJJ96715.1 hypothetical protein UB43_22830 [Pseudomonas sp. 21]MBV7583577.1 class I SAM-dependent methyltransferase [Pseudomonas sp. PDM33]